MYYFKEQSNQFEEYYNILHSTKKLYEKLKLEDSFEVFMVYTYMLWNGYFSLNKNYYFNYNRKIIEENYALGIVNGKGTCLENSYMLNDLYKVLGYDSYIVKSKINMLKVNQDFIKRKVEKKENNIKDTGNICVLVKDNKYDSIYDPTNICLYKPISKTRARVMNGNGLIKIDNKSEFYCELEKEKLNEVLKKLKETDYTKREINHKMKLTIEKCHENVNKLYLFYHENELNRKNLVKQLRAR